MSDSYGAGSLAVGRIPLRTLRPTNILVYAKSKRDMKHPDPTIIKALAVEPRTTMIRLLGGTALCAGALARAVGITPGAASQHLAVLKACGLVVGRRRGRYVHYHLAPDARAKARQALDALFAGPAGQRRRSKGCTRACRCPAYDTTAKDRES